jgi:hypothetical protein
VPNLPSPQDDQDRKLLADVANCGWHLIKVPECGSTPGWAFSVGLYHSFEHPEIVLFGLPIDTMHQIINNLVQDIRAGGSFPPGSQSTEILEGYTCSLKSVARCWYHPFLGYATWFYQGTEFPVVQCLWPDRDGALPDDSAFDSDLTPLQPLLWHAEPSAARAEALLHSVDT